MAVNQAEIVTCPTIHITLLHGLYYECLSLLGTGKDQDFHFL